MTQTHDPLCPHTTDLYLRPGNKFCVCDLLRQVREDERDNCWAAVAEMEPRDFGELGDLKSWIIKPDALAAIEWPKGSFKYANRIDD